MQDADVERRSRLLGIKLRALMAEHLGTEVPADVATAAFPSGAAVVMGERAWVLIDGDASGVLGRALAWMLRAGASSMSIVADEGGGELCRLARHFTIPIDVWFPQDRSLLPTVPVELPPIAEPTAAHLALVSLIQSSGADIVIEHGVVTGDVRGLEVCRVVDEPTHGALADVEDLTHSGLPGSSADGDDGVFLEVGVGAADREAFQLLHGDVPTPAALRSVVESVEQHRRAGAQHHPLNRLVPERALRWKLCREPKAIGLDTLEPVEPPTPRHNLRDVTPCVAVGSDADGRRAVVVCSVGVDLGLAPFVADVVGAFDVTTDDRLIVVVPDRDAVPITRELLELLSVPPTVVAAPE